MPNAKAKGELLRLTYECAADPLKWPLFLQELAQSVRSDSASLVIQDLKNLRGSVAETWGVDPFWQQRYAEYYGATNVWTQQGDTVFRPGVVIPADHLVSASELVKTEFYNDYLRPQAALYCMGGTVMRDRNVTSFVTTLRSKRAGSYRASELLLLQRLMPHLQTVARIRSRIAGLEGQLQQLGAALDDLPQGMILVDRLSRVLFMNRRAEAMVREKDGLWVAPDGLHTNLPLETTRLPGLIAFTAGQEESPGGVLSLLRPGKPPLKLLISPLLPSLRRMKILAGAMIWVAFPEPLAPTSPALLQRLFQFTAMEARLAAALLEGKSLGEFADAAGIAPTTVKTHLNNVFAKTGVSRQSALIRCLMSVTSQLGRPR